jgi:hypothetical protein
LVLLRRWVPACFSMRNGWCQPSTTPPLARVGRIRSLTEARRQRGREAWPFIRCARRASEPKERCSSPRLRASVRELLIESSTTTEAKPMSARQTESGRSPDAVCGTIGVSGRLRHERFRRLASAGTHGLPPPPISIHARGSRRSGDRSNLVPVRRSLRNDWCQPSTPTRTVPQTRVCGHSLRADSANRDSRQREPPQRRSLRHAA